MCKFILYSYYSKVSFVLAFRAASLPLLGFVGTVLHFTSGPRLFILTSVPFVRSLRTFPLFGYWKIINTKPQYQFFVVTSLAYMTSQAFEVAGEGTECGLLVNFLAPRCPTHRGKESHQSKGVFNW